MEGVFCRILGGSQRFKLLGEGIDFRLLGGGISSASGDSGYEPDQKGQDGDNENDEYNSYGFHLIVLSVKGGFDYRFFAGIRQSSCELSVRFLL